jgi:hypothetical protein
MDENVEHKIGEIYDAVTELRQQMYDLSEINDTNRRLLDIVKLLEARIEALENAVGIVHSTWDLMDSPDLPPGCE